MRHRPCAAAAAAFPRCLRVGGAMGSAALTEAKLPKKKRLLFHPHLFCVCCESSAFLKSSTRGQPFINKLKSHKTDFCCFAQSKPTLCWLFNKLHIYKIMNNFHFGTACQCSKQNTGCSHRCCLLRGTPVEEKPFSNHSSVCVVMCLRCFG